MPGRDEGAPRSRCCSRSSSGATASRDRRSGSARRSVTRATPPTRRSSRSPAQMQAFLASDVVYAGGSSPLIKQALDEADIGGQRS